MLKNRVLFDYYRLFSVTNDGDIFAYFMANDKCFLVAACF